MQNTKEVIIETQNLEFGFNEKVKVLKNISLKVERGSIYGFLGANGAGKTTTIRLLLGLLNTPENKIQLFNRTMSDNRPEILSRTGSLIEHPSLYEHLSGYDNLEIIRLVRKLSRKKVAEVLEKVKLSEVSGRKVSQYSMGMKQRLGLALALLGEPELLILDEPVNGLDPKGIVEIRELLKNLNRESGTTIFLSSHLLSEIEKMVTHIGIINAGEMIFQGTISELREIHAVQCEFHLETNNNQEALEYLGNRYPVKIFKNELIVKGCSKNQVALIISDLVKNKIDIYMAFIEHKDLEQLFLGITEEFQVNRSL
jgi:ABC-type multidrug transport system ATPase subunit